MDKIIIHISGSSGSGKTTLGNKLKEKLIYLLFITIV